jgi:hypothetical protein
MLTVRLPPATPPVPTEHTYDVVISQLVGLPATGSSVRSKPTGGSEWQVVVLAEALASRGLRVAVIGPFFAYALDRGVHYLPAGEVLGRRDALGNQRPTVKVRAEVLVSERFGTLPAGVEFQRLVVDLHDLPDQMLGGVMNAMQAVPGSKVVVHSEFTASLLDGWPNVNVIPCMLPDEFYHGPQNAPRTNGNGPNFNAGGPERIAKSFEGRTRHRYVYGSAAMKGLEPTLALWKQLKQAKVAHFKRATLTVTNPGYDAINPEWLKGVRDVEVVGGLSPAGMQELLADSDGIFMASTFPETFGIVFHQCELAGKPARVLQLHRHKDALWEVLALDSLFVDPNTFVASFDDNLDWPIETNDYRVSTVLPKWLEVLGLSAGASEATDPPATTSDVPAAGSTQESAA